MTNTPANPPSAAERQTPHELWRGIHATLRTDIAGGVLLLTATVLAVVLANTPAVGATRRSATSGSAPKRCTCT